MLQTQRPHVSIPFKECGITVDILLSFQDPTGIDIDKIQLWENLEVPNWIPPTFRGMYRFCKRVKNLGSMGIKDLEETKRWLYKNGANCPDISFVLRIVEHFQNWGNDATKALFTLQVFMAAVHINMANFATVVKNPQHLRFSKSEIQSLYEEIELTRRDNFVRLVFESDSVTCELYN